MEPLSSATASSDTWNITCNPLHDLTEPLLEKPHPLGTQTSRVSNTSNESGVSITTEKYNANISGHLPESVTSGIVEEINSYINEAKKEQARLSCMSLITWLIPGTGKEESLKGRIHEDMRADLSRSHYFVGDKEISVAGDENASFELFKKEIEKNEFNWVEKNIEIISKFFHQGLIQIVLSQLLKARENMPAAQLFNGNVNAFENGLRDISFDGANQEISYRFHENKIITLEIDTRLKYAGFSSENSNNLLIASDKENIVSPTGSTTVPTSRLSLTIGFILGEDQQFSIYTGTNNYAFVLDAKRIMNT